MKINILGFSLLLGIFPLVFLAKSSSSSSLSLLGIPPQDEDYFKTETIKCKNGSKKFTRAQLNDDFCDCLDGTDEPGTSACPEGKFYCQNAGHLPVTLPSSRVNDGICDCCDGSDEYDGTVKCPNTCWEAGKVTRNKLQRKIDMYKEGVTLRKLETEKAKRAMAKDNEELLKLKNEEKILKGLVKKLEVYKEQIEKAEEKERLEKEKEEKNKDLAEGKDVAGEIIHTDKMENSGSDDGENGSTNEPSLDELEKDEISNSELLKDGSGSREELSKEELGRLVASRWTGEKTGSQAEEIRTVEDNHGGSNENSESNDDEIHDKNSDIATDGGSSWLEKMKDTVRNILQYAHFSPPPLDKLEVDRIRDEYNNATTRLSDIEARMSSLTEKLKHDFGTQKEFYLLYDQCFETKQDKYVYKVCPFKEAVQEEDYHKTQLGDWEKFENSYQYMLFSNGQGCWNGPSRSLKVKLRCGLKTELIDVDEPSRCEYAASMTTPLLCQKEKLEELKRKLEALSREQQDDHDEL